MFASRATAQLLFLHTGEKCKQSPKWNDALLIHVRRRSTPQREVRSQGQAEDQCSCAAAQGVKMS